MRPHTFPSVILLITAIVLSAVADAAQIPRHLFDGGATASGPGLGSELATLLKGPKIKEDNLTYTHALTLIASLKTSATCTRLATSTFLTSCQEIESSENLLDEVKSVYAARLAVCELLEAGTTVPSQCSPFIPTGSSKRDGVMTSYFTRTKRAPATDTGRFEKVNTTKLVYCLQGLGSRPQWWTSYSNARQNAVVICQAVRGDIERDELLKVYEAMTDVTNNLGISLSEAIDRASTYLGRQKKFAEAIQLFQGDVQEGLERTHKNAQGVLSKLMGELEMTIQRVSGKLVTAGKNVESQFVGLNKNITLSTEEVDVLRKTVGKTFQEMIQGSSDLALKQTSQWELNQELVNGAMDNMQMRMNTISMTMSGIEKQLDISKDRSSAIDEKLISLSTEFNALEARLEDFRIAYDRERELVTQYHELLQKDIQTVLNAMQEATYKALNLQSVVNETSAKLEDIGIPEMISLIKTGLRWYFWFGLGVVFLVIGNAGIMTRFSMAALCVCMVYQVGLPTLIGRILTAIRTKTSILGAIFTGPSIPVPALYPAIGDAGDGLNLEKVIQAVILIQDVPLIMLGVMALWCAVSRSSEHHRGIRTTDETDDLEH